MAAADELEHLSKVEQILKSLTKLIHGKKLYADNNPRLAEFAAEFDSALQSYFAVEDTLVLHVEQFAILWRETRVYENQKREESIAFLLYRDGVGEITIESKAIGRETDHLVKILTDEYHKLSSDDDVVTKFWNADFENISYRVLEDYLSNEYGDGLSATSDSQSLFQVADHPEFFPSLADKGRVIIQKENELDSIDDYLKKLILKDYPSMNPAEREQHFQKMAESLFTVSSEEISRYNAELTKEKSSDCLAQFVEAIIVFTRLRDNPTAVRDVCSVVERIVNHAVGELNPTALAKVLNTIRNFRQSHDLPDNIGTFCDKLEQKIVAAPVVQSLSEKLESWNEESENALAYFAEVGSAAVDPLLKVLHNVEGEKLHRGICDALIDMTQDEVSSVIERLDVDNGAVACDAVYMANKIGMTQISPKIQELLFYPDVKVKEEMIKLVARTNDPASVELLLKAIDDESKRIRFRAMDAAAEKNDPRVLARMTEIAFDKTLSDREPDEQEMIFKVLGRVGDAGTVDELKKFIEKKSFMQFGKQRENKLLVIRALEQIKTPASLGLLKRLAKDSNTLVQTRAQRARELLEKSMRAQGGRDIRSQEDREK